MKMEYRRLTSNDLDAYFEIRLRALQNSPSAFLVSHAEQVKEGRDFFAKTLDDQGDNAVIFGALVDRKVIATLGIFREQRQKIAHKSVIWGMYVEEEFRKQGTASKLLELAIDFAKTRMQTKCIFLSAEAKNESALALYKSHGFKSWGQEPMAMFADGQFFEEIHLSLIF